MAYPLRDGQRLVEITGVLSRFGGGWLLAKIGLGSAERSDELTPQRLAHALETLGPVFVKLGQILSTRRDLIGPDWADELARLRSGVTPLPWSAMEGRISQGLGRAWREVFSSITPEPIGSASVAQVYAAQLLSGEDVVIKVTRPDQEDRIAADLRLLEFAASRAASASAELRRLQPAAMVRELSRAIRAEFDLTEEAGNTLEVGSNLSARAEVQVPKVHEELSSRDLMVQERILGVPPSDAAALADAGLDGPTLARAGAAGFMQMLLQDGIFHADPHPGNLFALPGNRMAFIDFGMVGRLSRTRQRELVTLLKAIVGGDARGFARQLLRWSEDPDGELPSGLETASARFIARHSRAGLDLSAAIDDIMEILREARLILPPDLVLLFKAMATADGTMKLLDPAFDTIAAARPFVVRDLMPSAEDLVGRLGEFAEGLTAFGEEAPELMRAGLRRLSTGKLRAEVSLADSAGLGRALENAAWRIAVGLVSAAGLLILGPVLVQAGPEFAGLPLGSWIGCLMLAVGAALVLRRRRG